MTESELMRLFLSMGCDCEFGSVQRKCRSEPPDLLRWGGADMPMLLRMLNDRFQYMGDTRYLSVIAANDEYFVANSHYGFRWHAWVKQGEMPPDRVLKREVARLPRQAEILIDDLTEGSRILVRKVRDEAELARRHEFVAAVGAYGGSHTLFVSQDVAKAGVVEREGDRLLRGYVAAFADGANIMANADPAVWIPLCRRALALMPG